jgi:aldose 1-epimerase
MPLTTIHNDFWKLTISPEFGASPYALEHQIDGQWTAIMRPSLPGSLEAGRSTDFSSYTLAPYSNRIRAGAFEFRGRKHQLRANWPDGQTIHGDVHGEPWHVTQPDSSILNCEIDSGQISDLNFPFSYRVRCQYKLEAANFITTLEMTNTGSEVMPAGFGIHPYFQRRIPGSNADCTLEFEASGWYRASDPKNPIPVTAAGPIPIDKNFSQARAINGQFIDGVYNGFAGVATLEWPGSGHRMKLEADPIFSHFVVFTAPDGTLALEPVTNATDGFNLHARGIEDVGVCELEPNETMRGSITLRLEHSKDAANVV